MVPRVSTNDSTNTRFDARAFLRSVSEAPGVYRMYDAKGDILYVGKARRLKARLSSYFRSTGLNTKTRALVSHIADIQVTVTHTETEALLLEQTLIKKERPPYNILMRDDKSYPYVFANTRHAFPKLEMRRVRRPRNDGRYYGPYPSSVAVRDTLQLMQKIFRIRNCEDSEFSHRERPCLQYQINRCTAPCVGHINEHDYQQQLEHATQCLEGRSEQVAIRLSNEMEAAASSLAFEKAAFIRDQIQQLRSLQSHQSVDMQHGNADVFAYIEQPGGLCITLLSIRDGRVLGTRHFTPDNGLDLPSEALMGEFISQYYLGLEQRVPTEVLVNVTLEDQALIEEALSHYAERHIRVTSQVRGHRAQWVRLAQTNAEQHLASMLSNQKQIRQRFIALREALGLAETPKRLECFDISHSHGEATVASCVVFDSDMGPNTSEYRRFNINGVAPGDDYAAMRQALTRRYTRLRDEDQTFPDVLIVDGGKGQLNMARDVLEELAISDRMTLLGVAKGTTRKPGLETLFLETTDQTVTLEGTEPALHLVQHIRDESHRFAITGHRRKRDKQRRTSSLEGIAGIGPKRRQALLRYFGGLQGIRKASLDDIANVPGISRPLADTIYQALNG